MDKIYITNTDGLLLKLLDNFSASTILNRFEVRLKFSEIKDFYMRFAYWRNNKPYEKRYIRLNAKRVSYFTRLMYDETEIVAFLDEYMNSDDKVDFFNSFMQSIFDD